MNERREYEFELTSSSDVPPLGFYKVLDYEIIIQTEEKLYTNFTRTDFSIKIRHKEETEKDNFINMIDFFGNIFSLGFNRSFDIFKTGLHLTEQIEKFRSKHPFEYKLVFTVLIEILNDFYKRSKNEVSSKKTPSPYSRFIRSIRKYKIALENKFNPIEYFENMWIAFEALFHEMSYKTDKQNNRNELRNKYVKKIKKLRKQLREEENERDRIKVIDDLNGQIIQNIWKVSIPDTIKLQYKNMIREFNDYFDGLFNEDSITKLYFNEATIDEWYDNRNNLFHDAKISDVRKNFFEFAQEIEKSLRFYYFMFLTTDGILEGIYRNRLKKTMKISSFKELYCSYFKSKSEVLEDKKVIFSSCIDYLEFIPYILQNSNEYILSKDEFLLLSFLFYFRLDTNFHAELYEYLEKLDGELISLKNNTISLINS